MNYARYVQSFIILTFEIKKLLTSNEKIIKHDIFKTIQATLLIFRTKLHWNVYLTCKRFQR